MKNFLHLQWKGIYIHRKVDQELCLLPRTNKDEQEAVEVEIRSITLPGHPLLHQSSLINIIRADLFQVFALMRGFNNLGLLEK